MGIYEDVMASLTGGSSGAGPGATMRDRAMDIADIAMQQGYVTPLDPRFAQANPELAAEWFQITTTQASGLAAGLGGRPQGALSPPRVTITDSPVPPPPPGSLASAAAARALPPAGGASYPPTVARGNPNPIGAQGPIAGGPPAPPRVSGDVVPPPGAMAPRPSAPGQPPIIDGQVVGASSSPIGGGTPPSGSPINPPYPPNGPLPPVGPAPVASAGSSAGGGMLQNAWNAAQSAIAAHPIAAGAALAGGFAVGGGIGAMNRPTAPSSASSSAMPNGYEQPAMPGRQEAHDDQVERERQADYVRQRRNRELETQALEAATAYANAQRAELEKRLANADMTDSQKEAVRVALERELAATREAGATDRSNASIAGEARNTDVREAGATARSVADNQSRERITGITEAGANSRTATTEAGQNTRSVYQGGVQMRGQDQQAREAQDNFVTQTIANNVANGRLSVEKANKMISDYVSMAKLPTDILKQVSDSIQPFLPYMTNRSMGEAAPGFEKGGAMERLTKLGGGKYDPSAYKATSDFNLMDIAAQYGGGPPAAPPKQLDVQGVYGSIPDVNTNPDAYRGQSASSTQLARPTLGGGEQPAPMVQGMLPQQVTPPMGDDVQQRIYASLGR